jgi:hypothetical protein
VNNIFTKKSSVLPFLEFHMDMYRRLLETPSVSKCKINSGSVDLNMGIKSYALTKTAGNPAETKLLQSTTTKRPAVMTPLKTSTPGNPDSAQFLTTPRATYANFPFSTQMVTPGGPEYLTARPHLTIIPLVDEQMVTPGGPEYPTARPHLTIIPLVDKQMVIEDMAVDRNLNLPETEKHIISDPKLDEKEK